MPKRVLLVDDDPHFRKLLTPALTDCGLSVISAGKVRTARRLLEKEDPHLLIVDGLLPDMSGISWIEELRGNENLTPIVFVSAFWKDQASYRHLVQDLGVSIVAYKPVDPTRFAANVAALLRSGKSTAPPPPQVPRAASKGEIPRAHAAGFESLRLSYVRQLPVMVGDLAKAAFEAIRASGDPEAVDKARRIAHDLRGTAGSFGLGAVGDMAAELEDSLMVGLDNIEDDGFWDIGKSIGLGEGDPAPIEPDLSADPSLPSYRLAPHVLVVTEDPTFAAHLRDASRDYLEQIAVVAGAERAEAYAAHADVVLVSLPANDPEPSLRLIASLRDKHAVPVGVVALHDSMELRLSALDAGAALFVAQPLDYDGLSMAVRKLVESDALRRARVVVVSEDDAVVARIGEALSFLGVHVEQLANPDSLFGMPIELVADVLIIDKNVADVAGVDLCRAIRASPTRMEQSILLLAGDDTAAVRLEALRAGADHVLLRYARPEVCVQVTTACLGRARRRQARLERDPLTGLRLGSAVLPMLAARLSEARRQGFSFTIAVVDIANLGKLNDKYGVLAGDRVLAMLGRLLAGRFRQEDVRGRLGDDSFLLGFSGSDPQPIVEVLRRVQEEFAAFSYDGQPDLTATFDLGVAGYPQDGGSVSELIGQAWKRLSDSG